MILQLSQIRAKSGLRLAMAPWPCGDWEAFKGQGGHVLRVEEHVEHRKGSASSVAGPRSSLHPRSRSSGCPPCVCVGKRICQRGHGILTKREHLSRISVARTRWYTPYRYSVHEIRELPSTSRSSRLDCLAPAEAAANNKRSSSDGLLSGQMIISIIREEKEAPQFTNEGHCKFNQRAEWPPS